MEMSQNDFDRIVFAELARKTSEAAYIKNPLDADNLTKWGAALFELAQCQSGDGCVRMLEEAISKLEEALQLNPSKHETIWLLGNVLAARGFCLPDIDEAKILFDRAAECFLQAVEEDPGNEKYTTSLNLSAQAPMLHEEIQKQVSHQQVASRGGSSTSNGKASKKKQGARKQKINSDLKYDILGWVILAAGIFAWAVMKSQGPPPPPSW